MKARSHDQEAADPAPDTGSASGHSVMLAARVLALQRSYGNAAVSQLVAANRSRARVIARNDLDAGVPLPAGVDNPEARFDDAVLHHRWDEAARELDALPDKFRIEPRLRSLGAYDLAFVLRSAELEALPLVATARRVVTSRSADIARYIPNAIRTRDWPGAAALLNALSNAAIREQLAGLQLDELVRLADHLRATEAGTPLFEVVDAQRRTTAYRPLESLAVPAPPPGNVSDMRLGSAAGASVPVAGGEVTTYGGATDPFRRFGFDYRGADAQRTAWIQFVAQEAEMFDANDRFLGPVEGESNARGQREPRPWGTAQDRRWVIDTLGGEVPFVDAPTTEPIDLVPVGSRGAHTTGDSQTAFWDRPEIRPNAVFPPGRSDVDHVVVRKHLHVYLVRNMDVLYENTMTTTWRLTRRDWERTFEVPAPVNSEGAGRVTDRMRAAHHRALIRRFPEWQIYPHD